MTTPLAAPKPGEPYWLTDTRLGRAFYENRWSVDGCVHLALRIDNIANSVEISELAFALDKFLDATERS